jgi:putative membrane protein
LVIRMIVWNPVRRVACLLSVALVAVSACPKPHLGEQQAERPSDGNIAAMFLAANNTDVSYAQVALSNGRTSTPAVLAFASRMLSDHAGLNQAATQIFMRSGIVPEDNVASLDFRDESAAKRDTLRELHGAPFDSAYIANEVRYHTRLLAVIDTVLIPSARNPDLKSLMAGARPAVAAHLEHAQRVQAGLGK